LTKGGLPACIAAKLRVAPCRYKWLAADLALDLFVMDTAALSGTSVDQSAMTIGAADPLGLIPVIVICVAPDRSAAAFAAETS
jgi:hypothetical protein